MRPARRRSRRRDGTRLAKLAAGVDEAAEDERFRVFSAWSVDASAIERWGRRASGTRDADRECRTVLKQLRKLAVKKHSFYFEKMVLFSV